MKMKKAPILSPNVGKALNNAKENLKGLISTLGGGLSKGLEGTGIESHAGAMSIKDKAHLFDGTAIMDRFEEISDNLSGLSAQASVVTSALRFIPGIGKLNSFINVVEPLIRMGDGGAKIVQNLRDAHTMAKDNLVDSLHENIIANRNEIENDGGFGDLDEVEQRLALEMLIEQEESQIKRMMESLDYDEVTQESGLGMGALYGQIAVAATLAKDSGMGLDKMDFNNAEAGL